MKKKSPHTLHQRCKKKSSAWHIISFIALCILGSRSSAKFGATLMGTAQGQGGVRPLRDGAFEMGEEWGPFSQEYKPNGDRKRGCRQGRSWLDPLSLAGQKAPSPL